MSIPIKYIQRVSMRPNVDDKDVVNYSSAFEDHCIAKTEFEIGRYPSLLDIVSHLPSYQVFPVKTIKFGDGRTLSVLCLPHQRLDIMKALELMAKDKKWMPERHYLNCMVLKPADRPSYIPDTDVWWDIENHWFAALGLKTMERLQLALSRLRETWLKEGKIK